MPVPEEPTKQEINTGDDAPLAFTVLNRAQTAAVDVTAWAFSFLMKRNQDDDDTDALIAKSGASIVVSGVFNADPVANTQVATVTLTKAETLALDPGDVYIELKRVDSGYNRVLRRKRVTIVRALHRA